MSIFHVFSALFNSVDMEQVRFSYNTEYVMQFIIITKQQIEPSLTVDNNMYVKAENVHGSEMQQPIGLFSMTLQDLGLIHDFPGMENLNFKFHDFAWSVCTLSLHASIQTSGGPLKLYA